MTRYLDPLDVDWNSAEHVALWDEAPLWCAMAGLLLLRHVPLRAGTQALDLGCGTGFPLFELAGRLGPTSHVTGLDPWAPAVERARTRARLRGIANVTLHDGRGEAMPFADASFDLITANLLVNNLSDAPAVMRECHRVLRPGGTLALSSNVFGHMREFYAAFRDVLRQLGREDEVVALDADEAHRRSASQIGDLLADAAFRVTRTESEERLWRFADGTAMLNHHFIRLGFLSEWKAVVADAARVEVFAALEASLNARAAEHGELALTIPLAYVEATPA